MAAVGRRDVRRLPVPDLLHAADARLLAGRDRPRVPADDGRDHDPAGAIARRRLLPRFGPRPLVPAGCCSAAVAMLIVHRHRRRLELRRRRPPRAPASSALGLGLVFAPGDGDARRSASSRRRGRRVGDGQHRPAGRRLDRHRAAEHARRLGGHEPMPPAGAGPRDAAAQAAVHGYTTAFWWSAGIFAVGALCSALLLPSGVPEPSRPPREPVFAHEQARWSGAAAPPHPGPRRAPALSVPAAHAPIGNPWTPRRATASPPRARS